MVSDEATVAKKRDDRTYPETGYVCDVIDVTGGLTKTDTTCGGGCCPCFWLRTSHFQPYLPTIAQLRLT